jgi:glycosyltransferase involved in cell wall biosynthesis
VARLLLITPVRNEAQHIVRTARALEAQTRTPNLWLVVDDGSDDDTPTLLRALAREIPFMRVLTVPEGHTTSGSDRLALAAEARAFNWALAHVPLAEFTHLGKLDGDIELPREYYERLLVEFARDPELGIAGGTLVERGRGGWQEDRNPDYHVRGALKLYSLACFQAIGGIDERLGWDTIDETYARMRGYRTRSFRDLVGRHHRVSGSADGALRGHARHGQCAYILHYGFGWIVLRSLRVAAAYRPRGAAGVALLYGYLRSTVRGEPRVDDPAFRRFTRRELRRRLLPAGGSTSLFRTFVRRTS